ncbi:MAG: tetratricopeptide repeat protein [Oceanococcaceae bacterium]
MMHFTRWCLLLAVLLLANGCATRPSAQADWPWPDPPRSAGGERAAGAAPTAPSSAGARPSQPRSPDQLLAASAVGQSLVEDARALREQGDFPGAWRLLERGIAMHSRDPVLWFEMARIRLAQQRWQAAENLAQRALEYSLPDDAVSTWCWELTAEARAALGDDAGAAEARRMSRARL